jgi:hypothetical protein
MNWKPTNRWVAPYYEIVNSETRHPSTQYESGYARRLYSGTPVLSFVNVLADRVWMYVSFYNTDGAAQLDLSAQGGLDARTSDQFRVADNVKIPFQRLGNATRATCTRCGEAGSKSTRLPMSIPTRGWDISARG